MGEKNQIIYILFLPVVLENKAVGPRGACGAVGAMFASRREGWSTIRVCHHE